MKSVMISASFRCRSRSIGSVGQRTILAALVDEICVVFDAQEVDEAILSGVFWFSPMTVRLSPGWLKTRRRY